MKVSVCICTYNGEKFIEKQLQTILQQSRKVDEVILCDDGSKDRTIEIIKNFICNNQLEQSWKLYQNEVNKGYPGNFYYAMSLCTGDIVFLSDQDDLWTENKVEKMSNIMKENEQIELLASRWGIIDRDDNLLKKVSRGMLSEKEVCKKISIRDILYCNDWPGMCMCYKKALGESVVDNTSQSKVPHDIILGVFAAEKNGFYCMNQIYQYHRRHEANVAMEEHRARKLLNKERKVLEVKNYLTWLQELKESKGWLSDGSMDVIRVKFYIMQERLENLNKGYRMRIVKQYLCNRKEIRLTTAVCDWLICRK